MSMSHHVIGQRPADDMFEKHMKVLEACRNADVSLPEETKKYFGDAGDYNSIEAVRVEALEIDLENYVSITNGDGHVDRTVVLCELPQGVQKIIFRASW